MRLWLLKYSVYLLTLLVCFSSCDSIEKSDRISFNEDIRPILNNRCMQCHGGVKKNGNFSMLTEEEALAITKSGKHAIVPGLPDSSLMFKLITHPDPEVRMPQKGGPLSAEQIELLRKWIEQGAEWEMHWAFEPITKNEVPDQLSDNASPIDQFVAVKLDEVDFDLQEEAAPAVLLRRLSLDLTGLPPTYEEVEAFAAGDETYEEAVDRLLSSPDYGEHWATMWLDLARYADSKGYEADRHREIWKYRDWVIDALNADMPFDQFTIEQLAGDLLEDPTESQLIATAFHRNTMNNDEGGTDDEEFRNVSMIDRVSTTWDTWLGITMACAQCHDHPFDPFRQKEFYKFFAFLNNTADADRPDEYPTLEVFTSDEERLIKSLKEQVQNDALASQLRQVLQDSLSTIKGSTVPIMRELPDSARRSTHIFERGNWMALGEEVESGVPSILPQIPENSSRLDMARWIVDKENPLTARVTVNRFWGALFGKGLVLTQEDFGSQGNKPTHPELLDWMANEFMNDQQWSVKTLLKSIVMTNTYRQSSRLSPELLEADPYNEFLSRAPRIRLSGEQLRDQALKVSGLLSSKMKGPSVMPHQPDGIWQAVYNDRQWETSEGEDQYRRSLYTYIRRTSPYPSMITFDGPSREFCVNRRINTNTPLQALVTLNDPVYVEAANAYALKMKASSSVLEEQIAFGYRNALFNEPSKKTMDELVRLYESIEGTGTSEVAQKVKFEDSGISGLEAVANVIFNLDEFLTRE